ncbi:probable protein ABIL3 isoform X3 [Musa acuminata AAA Group]|uniref:probable protein ABIL3 isoform X3 n=1 Tax=Musa acuminata AAA Group TaxID=214697 RepID=UPI0031E396CC
MIRLVSRSRAELNDELRSQNTARVYWLAEVSVCRAYRLTSARAASRVDSHRNLLFVPSPTTTTTTHHDQCHGEEQCQENTFKLFSSWKKKKKKKKKKKTTMRKQTEEEMSPNSKSSGLRDCCKLFEGLRNMQSRLYSAAEYFELSYMNDDGKEMVMRSLKDYAVKAIANAVDHLGSVSYKVDNLLNYEVDEVSAATFEVSCMKQRLRTCQTRIDHECLSQQSLLIKPPKYHKHYILQGQSTADSGISMLKCQGFYPPKENSKLNHHQTASSATRHWQSPIKNVHSRSPSPCPSKSEQYLSPSQTMHSIEKISYNAYNPLTGARSAASRPNIPNSSKKYIMETQNSLPMCLHAERNNHSETERNPTRKRRFLNALIMRNRSWTDESLYSFLNEY